MPCVYLPGPAPAVTVANKYSTVPEVLELSCSLGDIPQSDYAALMVGRAVLEVMELYLQLGTLFLKLVDLFLHLAERFQNLPKLFL